MEKPQIYPLNLWENLNKKSPLQSDSKFDHWTFYLKPLCRLNIQPYHKWVFILNPSWFSYIKKTNLLPTSIPFFLLHVKSTFLYSEKKVTWNFKN